MTPTKTRTSLWATMTLTAGGASITCAWIDLSTVFESQIDIRLQNGSTGPTIPAQVQVQVANDYSGGVPTIATNFGGPLVGTSTNSDTNYFSITVPIGCGAVRLIGGSNTGQAVTVDADISRVTVIS